MDEYGALAQRVVLTMDDVRGCLVLSRDGLVLGAFPEDEEASVKPAWLRFVHVGDARRSFVEFGDQIWAFLHRGPYAAFVVSGTSVRPGVLLDQLEQALLTAEEARTKRDSLKVPDAAGAPSGRPRTPLHPQADRPHEVPVASAQPPQERRAWSRGPVAAGPVAAAPQPPVAAGGGPPPTVARGPFAVEAKAAPAAAPASPPVADGEHISGLRREPQRLVGTGEEGQEEGAGEIDRVMLAKEFSGLLQLDADADENSS